MKILLTGFEPFGQSKANPSMQVVERLAIARFDQVELLTALLPVDRLSASGAIVSAIENSRPDAVICLGQATGRSALSIERVAINLLDFKIADNEGAVVHDEEVVPGGPTAYFVTLPVRQVYDAIKAAAVPVSLSYTAGTYICNQVLYAMLHYLSAKAPAIPSGFIHVPALPEQIVEQSLNEPSMGLDTMIAGVSAAIRAISRMSNLA